MRTRANESERGEGKTMMCETVFARVGLGVRTPETDAIRFLGRSSRDDGRNKSPDALHTEGGPPTLARTS